MSYLPNDDKLSKLQKQLLCTCILELNRSLPILTSALKSDDLPDAEALMFDDSTFAKPIRRGGAPHPFRLWSKANPLEVA